VLILGDVTAASTSKLLQLLEAATSCMAARPVYTVKPHPNCMVQPESHPSLHLRVLTSPLAGILRDFDIACASNSTSAAVDAYLAGLPVVVMLDSTELNVSPLRSRPGVRFVSTPEELAAAMQTHAGDSDGQRARPDFFFLEPGLPRWRRLLALEPGL
jgi:surface carbohydrate biosynthesis protein (TIGR04326 family)